MFETIQLTEDELQQVRECGKTITVSPDSVGILKGLSDYLSEKVGILFNEWIRSQYYMTQDSNGLTVESATPFCDIETAEREARLNFPEVFHTYIKPIRDNDTERVIITGLYLTFIRSLGAELRIDSSPLITVDESKSRKIAVYDSNTAVSIITEEGYSKNIRSIAIPGQLHYDFKSDGSAIIANDSENNTIKKALNRKHDTQGFNVVLLEVIGAAIEQLVKEGANGTISFLREGLQSHLGIPIRKPSKEVLDYILKDKEPETDEERDYHDKVLKSYSFWVDLINLKKAGTIQTSDGPFVIFEFEGYNEVDDTIECDSPALRHIYKDIIDHPILGPLKNNKNEYEIPKIAPHVLRGNIYRTKNQATIEIVERIIIRVVNHGTQPDSKYSPYWTHDDKRQVSIKIKYKDLIESCPVLHDRMTKSKKKDGTIGEPTPQQKRVILKRAVFGETKQSQDNSKKKKTTQERDKYNSLIEAILHESTVLYEYYSDFKIKVDPISLKALNRTGITITHHGKNADYQKNPTLHAPEIT